MMKTPNAALTAEIRQATQGAELYNGGPSVHYGKLLDAYATNATLVYGLEATGTDGFLAPSRDTEILVVQRGAGDGKHGSWSGVSGFIDRPDVHDPLSFTIANELEEEVGIPHSQSSAFTVHMGQRFTEARQNGGTLYVVPVAVAVDNKPEVRPDGVEVVNYSWTRLGHIATLSSEISFSPGYLTDTLPGALAAFGLDKTQAADLMGLTQG